MIQFQENTQMSGSKDGQIIFHGILLATARGLASKNAINWHLKVKNVEYNVRLTNILHHSQHAKGQLNP